LGIDEDNRRGYPDDEIALKFFFNPAEINRFKIEEFKLGSNVKKIPNF
jgi:hypothetical protein